MQQLLTGDMSASKIRQNYHPDCESAINKQINVELHASYVYQSMVVLTIFAEPKHINSQCCQK